MATFPSVKVEVAFTNQYNAPALGTALTWVDISSDVKSFSVRRGRSTDLERTEAGTASVVLDNRSRAYDPGYTSGTYYGNLTPMKWLRISAVWSGTTYQLFTGLTDSWVQSWPRGTNYPALTTVQATDIFKLFSLWNDPLILSSPVLGFPAYPSAVLNWTIAQASVVVSTNAGGSTNNNFDAIISTALDSTATLIADVRGTVGSNVNMMTVLQNIVDQSEHGVQFVSAGGRYTFITRAAMSQSPYNVVQATFGDLSSAGELGVVDLATSEDDRYIYNLVTVTPNGSSAGSSAQESTSWGLYGRRRLSYTSYYASTAQDALAAPWTMARYAYPSERIDRVIINPLADPTNLYPVVLGRELMDMVRVNRRPWVNGAASAVKTLDGHIESISHDADSERMTWRTQYTVSPQTSWAFWVLDSSVNSLLGQTTVLGY